MRCKALPGVGDASMAGEHPLTLVLAERAAAASRCRGCGCHPVCHRSCPASGAPPWPEAPALVPSGSLVAAFCWWGAKPSAVGWQGPASLARQGLASPSAVAPGDGMVRHCHHTVTPLLALPEPRGQERTEVPQGTARPVHWRTGQGGEEGRRREDAELAASPPAPGFGLLPRAARPRRPQWPWGQTPRFHPLAWVLLDVAQLRVAPTLGMAEWVPPSQPWGHQTPWDPQDGAGGATSASLCPIPRWGMRPCTPKKQRTP